MKSKLGIKTCEAKNIQYETFNELKRNRFHNYSNRIGIQHRIILSNINNVQMTIDINTEYMHQYLANHITHVLFIEKDK